MTSTATEPPPNPPSMITPARRRMLLITGPLLVLSVVFAGMIIAQDLLPGSRDFAFSTEAPGAPLLTVETGRSGIELEFRSGPSDRLRVFASGGYSGQQPQVIVAADGSRIDADCPSGESFDCGIEIEIEVPSGTALTANNRAGRISVDGISGALDLTARNGDVEITGAAGPIQADATNGRVQVENSTSTRVNASTRNGSIDLALTEPLSVVASTINGEIMIDLAACVPYDVDIDPVLDETVVSVPVDSASPRKIKIRGRSPAFIECG
ncbi:DUF4097 family beta strand repeat-containing protein [Microlunatus speluncae]|uniref:DUF4097 family beta strand repeat-containing protein n=1 Tax=Microlunatus speluncae TaxID=2594267 RepID=UPI001266594B|nr:DUF4097 family beta strand repeat-containing protein [Microlunatus speluncae]